LPEQLQRRSSVSWIQRTPAGLPPGIPGMGEEIEGDATGGAIGSAVHRFNSIVANQP
jgi:hypothetical protein